MVALGHLAARERIELAAQELATSATHAETTPEHLLVALMEQVGGLVPSILGKVGIPLDAATQQTLSRGARLVASLNQPAFQPWPVEEQVRHVNDAILAAVAALFAPSA